MIGAIVSIATSLLSSKGGMNIFGNLLKGLQSADLLGSMTKNLTSMLFGKGKDGSTGVLSNLMGETKRNMQESDMSA